MTDVPLPGDTPPPSTAFPNVHSPDACYHEYTRPATRDDPRPYCVRCLSIIVPARPHPGTGA